MGEETGWVTKEARHSLTARPGPVGRLARAGLGIGTLDQVDKLLGVESSVRDLGIQSPEVCTQIRQTA